MIHQLEYVLQIKQDINSNVYNMISGINESKTLPKYISCNCRCEYDSRTYNVIKSEIMINVNISVKSQ